MKDFLASNNYSALQETTLKANFLDYVTSLSLCEIDYFAIGVQDTINKKSISMMSRSEWQATFISSGLADYDPIRNTSFATANAYFSFASVDYRTSAGKEVMHQRKLHEITNGIVVMYKRLGHNFMLTLATNFSNFQGDRFYIEKNKEIYQVFNDLISFVAPQTKNYQPNINCLNA